jgi:hypothetical protein
VIVSSKARWLAVATGCFTAIAGSLGFTWGFAIVPSFLIVGAVVQPRLPRTGRVLMCAGALALTLWVLSFCFFILPENRFTNRPDVLAVTLVSVLLVALCDVALVMEEVKSRRTQGGPRTEMVSVSNRMRWLAGVAACVTGVFFSLDQGLGLLSGFLIAGALLAGRFPRHGRDLIWFGAVVVSLTELPMAVWMLLLSTRGGTDPRVTTGAAASVLFMVWCDAALVMEAFKTSRARHGGKPEQ